ncbi:sugar transferase [Subtercola frigoramans]|uniref:Exopolysaccharide biosynthesis polyprenyl glycosylphosphotransferase n=1 Tax=Subtercola frigoramans TaxID=120298 RepID=A0ABS2L8I3_9MICO|nr:sugar transferase [Subtercola frigoramans]MBM7473411.1 exopolysaccharide biosynthesis polyprenyl glycosylphosphotransferase [Subtercola frigoramans]
MATKNLEDYDWRRSYARRLVLTDFIVISLTVALTQLVWFGFGFQSAFSTGADVSDPFSNFTGLYTVISISVVALWMLTLSVYGSRGDRIVGTGNTEYRVIFDVSWRLFGLLAIVAFLFRIDFSRGFFLISLPLGVVALVLSRVLWRRWLKAKRQNGAYSAQVLLVGSMDSVLHIARELGRFPEAGYHVVGACTASGMVADYLPGTNIPIAGNVELIGPAILATGADTIVITSSDELSADKIRELSWSLEPGRQHLVVAPSLTDIGGPRIHTRPVAGLPLIHVETPRYEGFKRYQKRIFDVVSSGLLLLVLSPVLIGIAMVVRLSTPGPVLFKQERIGLDGSRFFMLKFRSMVPNAEDLLKELVGDEQDAGNAMLFKMKDDPRITPIGKVLRRYSLDELPQLINVFRGDMSLIGPRPPLQREVDQYESHVHRRFLMKPGITGLWQVSGRSDLSWEDSVRLDLYYVENWSMVGDFVILLKTARAVLGSDGAY